MATAIKVLKSPKHKKLSPKDLRWKCDTKALSFQSTKELKPVDGIVGQDRAIKALKLGVGLRSPGYNVFISGLAGTGKATTVKRILESIDDGDADLKDYAYVYNFKDPDSAVLLTFPAGEARVFKTGLEDMIDFLRERIPAVLESEEYVKKKKKILEEYGARERKLLGEFEEKINKDGFTLGQIEVEGGTRPDIMPIIDDKPVPVFELEKMVQEGKVEKKDAEEIFDQYKVYQAELMKLFKQGMGLNKEMQKKLNSLEQDEVKSIINAVVTSFAENYHDKKIIEYLANVEENILENLHIFKDQKTAGEETPTGMSIDYFKIYGVNIILDNSKTKGRPVVIEISPSHTNLFGTIEKVNDGRGGWYADFTNIKSGSILKANGGFLVINATHLFESQAAWKTLKRVLTYRKLEIQDAPTTFQLAPTILKPEPIDINTKVILIGNNQIYSLLSGYEDDFKKIFKVKAEFDYEVDRSTEIMLEYAKVIKKLVRDEELLELNKGAMAYLLELAARLAGRKDRFTSRFSILADIVREATFWAREDGAKSVKAEHVRKAFESGKDRHGLYEEKVTSMIKENYILIHTDGEKTGQVNGLAVYGTDIYGFGKPVKITASVAIGGGKILNVDREAGLSGKAYDKGVLIITGYLKQIFGKNTPLSFSANLVFEQSYGMIDGDSASAAEICALISAIANVPIKQSLSITGSVNQCGDIQPIGGVNEKIEGFYDTCKASGFTGYQGVVIPHQNVRDLMLREDIIESVKKGEFAVYAVDRIEDAVEILTGYKAGERDETGSFPENTLYGVVEKQVKSMYAKMKKRPKKKNSKENKEKNSNNSGSKKK